MPEPDKGSDIRFSPVNKKGPLSARKKNTPSKAPADTFCVALSDVMCARRGADMKKARRSEPYA
ncbi:hypothetical protein EMO35_20780 [Escherichia coli]|nr:hypothetical protein [Escherichia coli]EEY5966313.1 hypothetical protein [Escherichia coli]EFA4657281.1 hypothetical protein [Escherichia coli]